jgi:xylulokinase
MAQFVGLDIGTSSTKGLAITRDGRVQASAAVAHGAPLSAPGISEQDPEQWVDSARRVLASLGTVRPAGIGLTGQMHGLVLLDARGRVLRPAILWNDSRATAERELLEHLHGVDWLIERTANRALPGFTAPSLLWVQRNEPDVWRRVRHIMLPKDYVRMRLCGELGERAMVTDVSDASGTLLFDVGARDWSNELLDALELDRGLLPRVVESPSRVGVTPEGSPVAAGAGDQAAAALGLGLADGSLGIALGTSGVVAGIQRTSAPVDAEARLQTLCAARPGAWQTIGVTLSAAGSIAWWSAVAGADLNSVEALLNEAAASPPGGDGLYFLPYLSGERAPHMDASARGAFIGLSAHHDRGAMTRAMLEGVAYSLADVLDLMRPSFDGDVARITGGAARSELVLTVLASVLDMQLELTAVAESGAYGAALLGALASGGLEDEDEAAATVRVARRVDPEPILQATYAEGRERFTALYPALHAPVHQVT